MLVKDERSAPASVRGIDVETEWRLLRTLQNATGDKLGLVARPGEKVPVAISPQMAADLEVEVGAELTLTGMTVDGAGFAEEVRVAYIFEGNVKNAALDLWVLMPLDDARRLIGASGSVANAVRVFLPDPEAEATVRAALEAAVGDRELSVRSWRETDEADWMTSVYVWKGVLYFFVGMLALLIVMGTFGVVSATTLERMREVGTMRAIGMTPLQAFGVLVAELLLVGVLAGAVAVGLALVILALTRGGVEATTEAMALSFGGRWLYPTLSAGVLAAGFVFTVTLAVVSGLAPISRSATVREIDALRHL
jgi:Predicted permease.